MQGFIERKLGLVLLTGLLLTALLTVGLGSNTASAVSVCGSISGHVYQADGLTPVAGAQVKIYPSASKTATIAVTTTTAPLSAASLYSALSGAPAASSAAPLVIQPPVPVNPPSPPPDPIVTTGFDGSYTFTGLTPGDYYLLAYAEGFVDQYYDNVTSFELAKAVSVFTSRDTANVNFGLSSGGSLSGCVYAPDGVSPISGADISANSTQGSHYGAATSDSGGHYTISTLAAGSYRVYVEAEGYLSQYYDNSSYSSATPVSVAELYNTPDINFSLVPGGSISGHVYQADGRTPIAGARLEAKGQNCPGGGRAVSDTAGGFTIRGLLSGDYIVSAEAEGYIVEYYSESVSPDYFQPVPVTIPADTPDIDFTLDWGGQIAGHVYLSDGVTPIFGASVEAASSASGYGIATTDINGEYTIDGLKSGDYRVRANARGYFSEYYDSVMFYDEADQVSVTAPDLTPNINFNLDLGASISGRVYQSDGSSPLAGARVWAMSLASSEGSSTYSDSDGNYTIYGLFSGDYRVVASSGGYLPEIYREASSAAGATPVRVVAPNNTSGIDFSLDLGGLISGRVCQSDGTSPVPGARVSVYSSPNNCVAEALADTDGQYSIWALPTDNYTVVAYAGNYLPEYFDNASSSASAARVFVEAPNRVFNIDFSLDLGGAISGHVYQADGTTPISGAGVYACSSTGEQIPISTDLKGFYQIRGLPSGDYRVRASATGYLKEYYDGVYSSEAAALISVTAPAIVADIDFSLERGGSISGHVYQSDGVTPISGVDVSANSLSDGAGFGTHTGSDGSYAIIGLTSGNYTVRASSDGYFAEYYNGVASVDAATSVSVTFPSDTHGIDFTLDLGGSISGHVFKTDGVTPLSGVSIYAYSSNGGSSVYSSTDSAGGYRLRGLNSGSYVVRASLFGYLTQYYNEAVSSDSATAVSVVPPNITTGIDFDLELGGMISGHVYQADGATPVPGAHIYASPYQSGSGAGAITDSGGRYTIRGLASGSYLAQVFSSGYLTEYYDGASSSQTAALITVSAPNPTPNIDFTLDWGGSLSGRVFQSDGSTPLAGARVHAYSGTGSYGDYYTGSDGRYLIQGLPAGDYWVRASSGGYLTEYYAGAGSQDDATAIKVVPPNTIADIDFSLDWGGVITGSVYQADGTTPISNAQVVVFGNGDFSSQTYTDMDGNYSVVGLPAGNYKVRAAADGYLPEYYDETSSIDNATAVSVTPPKSVIGIDFRLDLGGTITGHIYKADGTTPLSGVSITVVKDNDGFQRSVSSGSTGTYSVSGLESGRYRVRASYSGYLTQYYDRVFYIDAADLVEVTAPGSVSNIDFVLTRGGAISGRVFEADGLIPINEAYVHASGPNGSYGGTYSNHDGYYSITNLPSGNYQVRASAPGFELQYYDGVASPEAAAPVAVNAPDTTAGIDFILPGLPPIRAGINSPRSVPAGSGFTTEIKISWVPDLCSFQFDLTYDPAVLAVDTVAPGLCGSTALPIDMWGFVPVDVPGTIRVLGRLPGSQSATGEGFLAQIQFQAIGQNGQSGSLALSNILVFDSYGEKIAPIITSGGSVQISDRGDVNGDLGFSMADVTCLERIILGLDEACSQADVNDDGEINMGDVTSLERMILGLD